MHVKANEGRKHEFLGVKFEILSYGKESMVTKMLFGQDDDVPFHKHPNEQSGYVISGQYKLFTREQVFTLSRGDSYTIPRNIEHKIEIIKAGEVIDFFSPPREDYLK